MLVRSLILVSALVWASSSAWAREGSVACEVVYERLKAEAIGDVSGCEKPVAEPKFEQFQADVPVGLMVYGHKGNNTEPGKAASCAATEWAHKLGGNKAALSKSIQSLEPTGWAPLGGVLDFANIELETMPANKDDSVSAPVVYLISDGEETCDGDPVASAKALHASGVRAAVNVIGFGVDTKTRAQLEAISEAGGGRYFPVEDSKALRKQLDAILESERLLARYNYCINIHVGRLPKRWKRSL